MGKKKCLYCIYFDDAKCLEVSLCYWSVMLFFFFSTGSILRGQRVASVTVHTSLFLCTQYYGAFFVLNRELFTVFSPAMCRKMFLMVQQ